MGIVTIRHPATVFKVAVVLFWLVLIGLLLKRDVFINTLDLHGTAAIVQAKREEYQGIYFRGKKIGYVAEVYLPQADQTVAVDQRIRMLLSVARQKTPLDLHLKARLDRNGVLRHFTFSFRSPLYRMHADGNVEGKRVTFTLSTGSATIHRSLVLNAPPLLSTSRQAYLLKKKWKKGQKFKVPWFDPISLTGENTVIEYDGRQKTLIRGRIYDLYHFVETYAGARVNSWLNAKGEVVKAESPAGFVFIREPEFVAMAGIEESPELLSAVSIKPLKPMPSLAGRRQMQYRLGVPDASSFQLDSGRQHYANGILTVKLERLADFRGQAKGEVPEDAADLAATPYIQSNAKEIRSLAAKIIAGKNGALARVRALAAYVFNHLEKRPVLGFPDALTVLKTGKGDCNEHAVLFAALARAADIPCRMVAGVVYFRGAFYYHAWDEVHLFGRWLSLDTTTDQIPADLGHIKFVAGGISEQMRIGALLGRLSIEPLGSKPVTDRGKTVK